ncbi:hypothetical protein DVR12_09915 [Chitinophaga silvatica]|uniref:Lipoprotein n=1 Tax=Chitinophaga silvatica TaxID=2282649 RepID=A0A3E1YBZ4_9BACT|nr:hypothetical protein [Chitinophaga silvatica]RFS23324.1 hypothetical protein DVR12_09915 [Chitinophaga silvatica]
MKYTPILLLASFLLIQACGNQKQETATVTEIDSSAIKNLISVYKGDFGNGPIYITLNFFNGQHVGGYNVHKGLRRNLHGDIKKVKDEWELSLSEPGDHAFDGVFSLIFNHDFNEAKGTWTANNKSMGEKKFKLTKVLTAVNGTYSGISDSTATFNEIFYDYRDSKSEIVFEQDGSCFLKLYPRITDSTYAEQLVSLSGSYKKENDTTLLITWNKNNTFSSPTSIFTVEKGEIEGEEERYVSGIKGEGYHFSVIY